MSVYQVEEYYISVDVPEDKVDEVKHMLDNSEDLVGTEISWSDNVLTIDNFDCENLAEDIDAEIQQII